MSKKIRDKNTPQTVVAECGVDSRLECSKCKSKISRTDNFCSQCGVNLSDLTPNAFFHRLANCID